MIASSGTEEVARYVVAVVGAGGVAAGIVALLKVRPEAGQITVSAAQGAVVVQSGVIDSLQEEVARLHVRISECETKAATVDELVNRTKVLEKEKSQVLEQNNELHERVRSLEEEVANLEDSVSTHKIESTEIVTTHNVETDKPKARRRKPRTSGDNQ